MVLLESANPEPKNLLEKTQAELESSKFIKASIAAKLSLYN